MRRLPDMYQAADYLAKINKSLSLVVNHLNAKYSDKKEVKRLYDNFNPSNVSEGSPNSGYTSYSVNKGERIVLCIRQKNASQTFADFNVVMYVALHEMAHLMTSTVGHDTAFWDNFKFLLQEAIDIGVYKQQDYQKNPAPYCGIEITNSVV